MTPRSSWRGIACALILAAAAWATPAGAWNARGHMLVAAIAWDDMKPATRTRAAELLRLNPLYGDWTASAPAGEADRWAFIRNATWPDIIRSRGCDADGNGKDDRLPDGSDGVWNGSSAALCYYDDGSTPVGLPRERRNIGYRDQLLHRYWHFKDIPFSPDGTPLTQPDEPNAATQIAAFRAALKSTSPASEEERSYALAWLEHLVGDMHQPLHATSRFTAKTKRGDNGGNSVKVCTTDANCTKKKAWALHSFWDGALGSGESLRALVEYAGELPDAPTSEAADLDVDAWIEASFKLARTKAYVPPIRRETGPYRITTHYRTQAAEVSRDQVALAGARLARVLDEALQ